MALATAETASLDWKLTNALHGYEADLSVYQKGLLRSEGLPDAMAVIDLTSMIGERISDRISDDYRQRRGQMISPFLESIQQSATLMEIFPCPRLETPTLFWGAVKLTLLIASDMPPYFDRLSWSLMKIGKECPRITAFESLRSSGGLQNVVYSYSASVVRLCEIVNRYCRVPVFTQPAPGSFSSFNLALGSYEEETKGLARLFGEEVSAALECAQLDSYHRREEQNQIRRLEIDRRNLERGKLRALDSLSTYDYQAFFKRQELEQVSGTWQWINDESQFHEWMLGSAQCLYLIGKSNQIDWDYPISVSHLSASRRLKKGDLVSFFFCQSRDNESLQCKTIVGSVVRQLVSNLPAQNFQKFGQTSRFRTATINFVQNALCPASQYFIILHNLDLCEAGQMVEVVETFHDLATSGLPLKILLTSHPDIPSPLLEKFPAQQCIDLDDGKTQLKVIADVQKIVQAKESSQEPEDKDILHQMHWLGRMLWEQEKYVEAERVLRQAVQGQERILGVNDPDTLGSRYWLGMTFFEQKNYVEAEQVFRQTHQGEEEVRGVDDIDTLVTKSSLARTLHGQKKYAEAEQMFRQNIQVEEKIRGPEHINTLNNKCWLGRALFEQKKYAEAEQVFRLSVQVEEEIRGPEHANTLDSKHWLGKALYGQKKYAEAEQVLQHIIQVDEKIQGTEHAYTIDSKFWLGKTLCKQKHNAEAKQLFQYTLQVDEKTLGAEHAYTLRSRYWLGKTLYEEQNYAEAEQLFRQSAQGLERTLGAEHEDAIDCRHALQETTQKLASLALVNNTRENLVHSGLDRLFVDGRPKYNDTEIGQISSLLDRLNPAWGKVPRTYIILRILKCQDRLDDFINLGFTDHWFPVTERNLPICLSPTQRKEFVDAQQLVMTQSLDLERGKEGQHAFFKQDDIIPFEQKGILGTGGFAQVDKVISLISFREYARKRVSRSRAFGGRQTEAIKQFITEIGILKRLKHHHVVEFIGSYTDHKYLGLIMSPVADMDLSRYLAKVVPAHYGELRTYFGCLARALEFLHEQRVRHKDIKPSNILIHGGNILFTDFGLSLDFATLDRSTTSRTVNGKTQRYCAPEVARQEPRNTASDVWSLGLVFLELSVVLKEKPVEYAKDFFKTHGNEQEFVRTNPDALVELVAELKGTADKSDDRVFGWVQSMLQEQQKLRPTAAALVTSILAPTMQADGDGRYCGICCADPDDEITEIIDDVEDHLRI